MSEKRFGRLSGALKSLGPHLLALLGYVLLTLLMTYPLAIDLGTHAAGRGNDMWVSHWNNWWVREALSL